MGIHKLWQVSSCANLDNFLLNFKQIVKPVAVEQSLADFCLNGAIFHDGNEVTVRPLVIGFDTRYGISFSTVIIQFISGC